MVQAAMEPLHCGSPSVCETLYMSSKNGFSLSSTSVELLQSNHAGLQRKMLWGLLLLIPDPQAGKTDVGHRPHSWERTSAIQLFSNLWSSHLGCMGFDYITISPPTILLGFFGCRVSF